MPSIPKPPGYDDKPTTAWGIISKMLNSPEASMAMPLEIVGEGGGKIISLLSKLAKKNPDKEITSQGIKKLEEIYWPPGGKPHPQSFLERFGLRPQDPAPESKSIGEFANKLKGEMKAVQEEKLHNVNLYNDWQFHLGDRVKSLKTGKIWEVTAQDWAKGPKYIMKTLDGKESASFDAAKAHEGLIKMGIQR